MESMILQLDSSLHPSHARRLAELWGNQLDQVIKRMLALTPASGRRVWPAGARAEAVGEIARLTAFLADRILADRTAGRSLAAIDPEQEERILNTPHFTEKVENTAVNLATAVWNKVFDDLSRKRGSLDPSKRAPWPPKLPGRPPRRRQKGTVINHYVPQFTTKPWADSFGRIRVITRDARGIVAPRLAAPSSFGYEKLLYRQGLEEWFSHLETAATLPYAKLIALDVLTPEDRYFWISFLVVQFLRTPSYMALIGKGLRRRAAAEGWPWPMTPDLIRRAYETTFSSDKVFAVYYRSFDRVRWTVLTASSPDTFPRTDAPVVLSTRGGWRCYYPLTPTQCFVAGPELSQDRDVPAALIYSLEAPATRDLAVALLRSSRRSFAVSPGDNVEHWMERGREALPIADPASDCIAWGGISGP